MTGARSRRKEHQRAFDASKEWSGYTKSKTKGAGQAEVLRRHTGEDKANKGNDARRHRRAGSMTTKVGECLYKQSRIVQLHSTRQSERAPAIAR